jgi:protein O-mannosyl-transferase
LGKLKNRDRISAERKREKGVSTSAASSKEFRSVLYVVALLTITIIAYLPASHGGFIWDDDDYVTNNPLITAPDGLKRIWFSLDSPSQYFPLVYSVFRVEHGLWGFNSAGYHWINILLHATNAVLLWGFLKRLQVPGAWLAAAIFALHPVQVESVAWITELKNVLSLFFFLLTLFAWWAFVNEAGNRRWRFYALSLGCYALALFSKTTVSTLPLVLLLILWLKEKRIDRTRLLEIIPFFILSIAMGLLTVWWERYHQGTHGQNFSISFVGRLLIASHALWFYLGKLLWPVRLTFSYPRWAIEPGNFIAYGWLALCAGTALLILYLRRFFGRSMEVTALFFAISLGPLLGFVMLYTFRYTFVADHYQYIASIGPISLAAAGVANAYRRFKKTGQFLLSIGCGMLLLMLAGLTWRQSETYANAETLWLTTLDRNPKSVLAHNNLGLILLDRGDPDGAINDFRTALAQSPDDGELHNNLGNALLKKGLMADAIAEYQKALAGDANFTSAHYDLGQAFFKNGQFSNAIVQYQAVLKSDPQHISAWYEFGNALLAEGRMDAAATAFEKTLAIDPNYGEANNNLGNISMQQGKIDKAIDCYQKALKSNPKNVGAHYNLGNALLKKGRTDDAVMEYETALKIDPDAAQVRMNLATVYLLAGRRTEAIAQYKKGLEKKPDDVAARYNLGVALLQSGRREDAVTEFKRVLQLKPDYTPAQDKLRELNIQ